ncbi:MAG: transposase [Pirellulaceae bacterium]
MHFNVGIIMTHQPNTNRRTEVIEVDAEKVDALLECTAKSLPQEDHELFAAIVGSYQYLSEVIADKETTIAKLRKLMFGSKSEKYQKVVDAPVDTDGSIGETCDDESNSNQPSSAESQGVEEDSSAGEQDDEEPLPGHGRNGVAAYTGARQVEVEHSCLQPGDDCPECKSGTLYEKRPGVLVRIVGSAPLQATVYRLQKLRCHLCGKTFTATAPAEAGAERYDATAVSMIALLKYGSGLPFNRLQRLQGNLGIPLPASTQWDVLSAVSAQFDPVYQELIRQAAQGEVVYNDDTSVKILELMGDYQQTEAEKDQFGNRSGVFTCGQWYDLQDVGLATADPRHVQNGRVASRVASGRRVGGRSRLL